MTNGRVAGDCSMPGVRAMRRVAAVLLGVSCVGESASQKGTSDRGAATPYHAAGEEGSGIAVAVVLDNSGSMGNAAPGDTRPKTDVARAAIATMLDATEGFIRAHPDVPVKVAMLWFASSRHVTTVLPVQAYSPDAVRAALHSIPRPSGGTAIGVALEVAREQLYRAGVFRKHILVVTDGVNTDGPAPDVVAREIWRRSQGGVHLHVVAFDTDPGKFAFLHEVQGDLVGAGSGPALRAGLDEIYQQRILAESATNIERPVAQDTTRPPR